MDYEKLYKDIINNLQQMVRCGKITVETARSICADFVYESENEMMWRLIKKYAKYTIPNAVLNEDHITRKQLETWLEKQSKSQKGLFASEAERYFPKSKENKDETIRKEIAEYFKRYSGGDSISIKFPEWIDWLEKQVENSKM